MQLSSTPSIELFLAAGKDFKISSQSKVPFDIRGDGFLTLMKSKKGNNYGIEIKNNNKKKMFKFDAAELTGCKVRDGILKFSFNFKQTNNTTVISGGISEIEELKKLECLMRTLQKAKFIKERNSPDNNGGSIKTNLQSITPNNKSFQYRKNEKETSYNFVQDLKSPKPSNDNYRDTKENTPKSKSKRLAMKTSFSNRKPLDTLSLETKQFYGNKGSTFTSGDKVKPEPKSSSPWLSKLAFPKIPKNPWSKRFLPPPLPFKSNKVRDKVNGDSDSTEEDSIIGFANLGNTCYMNAILQCLLNIPNFYQELHNQNNLALVPRESLYKRLCQLGFSKHNLEGSDTQKKHLQLVKESISSAANRFSGYAQHDAHEFLCQCMDQLKEDLLTQMSKKKDEMQLSMEDMKAFLICPIKENFETRVTHSIKCLGCEEQIVKEEEYHDFSLVIPELDENFNSGTLSIGKLLNLYFADEQIEYTCEKCKNNNSVLTHQMKKLPRILVLHLKRYDSYETKKSDPIKIPRVMDISKVVSDEVAFPSNFDLDCSLWKDSTIKSGIKRKSEDASFLASAPLNKTLKVNRDSYINEENAAEMIAISARESRKSDSNTSSNSFTKIQGPRKHLNFTADDNELDLTKDIKPEASLSFEERQLKEAMELSMQEYESQQRLDMSSFSLAKQTSTPAPTRAESIFQVLSSDSEAISDERQSYHLVGVVNHHGMNTASGHYTCDCYDFKSKQWRNYNDSSVKELDEFDWNRRSTSAYIVFYMHDICYQSIKDKY